MTPERWQQVRDVLAAARGMPTGERTAYLEKTCAQDPELRSEVESLVSSHDHGGNFFMNIPVADVKGVLAERSHSSRIGGRVGVYLIQEEIGHGGMGEVYRAVRADGSIRKRLPSSWFVGGTIARRYSSTSPPLIGVMPNIALPWRTLCQTSRASYVRRAGQQEEPSIRLQYWTKARSHYQRCQELWLELEGSGKLPSARGLAIQEVSGELSRCNDSLAKMAPSQN